MDNFNKALQIIKNDKYDCHSIIESVPVNSNISVLFKISMFAGMVGESIEIHSAYLINDLDNEIFELSYTELKALYKYIKGKNNRVNFWNYMNGMSPDAMEERAELQLAEIESIIK